MSSLSNLMNRMALETYAPPSTPVAAQPSAPTISPALLQYLQSRVPGEDFSKFDATNYKNLNPDTSRNLDPQSSDWYRDASALVNQYGVSGFGDMWRNGQWRPGLYPNFNNDTSNWLSEQLKNWQAAADPNNDFGDKLKNIVSNPANLIFAATTGQGGMTGANLATGGDVGKGALQDALALAGTYAGQVALPSMFGGGAPTLDPTGLTAADTAAINAGGAAGAVPAAGGVPPAPPTQTLQQILDSANVPSASNGVQVAQAGGAPIEMFQPQQIPTVDLTASPGVEALNNAAPGTITKGLTDAEVANSVFNPAAAGAGGGALGATLGANGTAPTVTPTSLPDAGVDLGGFNNAPNPYASGTPTAAEINAAVGAGGAGAGGGGVGAGTAAATAGLGSIPLSKVLSGDVGLKELGNAVSLGDALKTLGNVGSTAASVYGANETANKMKEISDQYMALGAPSRARYEASFGKDFDINADPTYKQALDTATESMLRKGSVGGNPFGNPGTLAEILKYTTGNVALPYLQNYRNQNAATGGYGAFNTAAPGAATGAVNAGGEVYTDIGRGLSRITNPQQSLAQFLKQAGLV